jgi:hypothetical protein
MYEDLNKIDEGMEWINFPYQNLDSGDINLNQHFRIELAHVLPEPFDEEPSHTAFRASIDEGRIVSGYGTFNQKLPL